MSGSGFWHMGGYALFVWGSYGVTALALGAEVVVLIRRRRALWQRLERMRDLERNLDD